MDLRIVSSRALAERIAGAVGGRVYPSRDKKDEARIYLAHAKATDLRVIAEIIDEKGA